MNGCPTCWSALAMLKVDYPAPFPLHHPGRGEAAQVENRVKVVVEHGVPALDAFLEQMNSMVRSGAVDKGIHTAEIGFNPADEILRLRRVGNIRADVHRSNAPRPNLRFKRRGGVGAGTVKIRATDQPISARVRAMARPIPRTPPVTKATLESLTLVSDVGTAFSNRE